MIKTWLSNFEKTSIEYFLPCLSKSPRGRSGKERKVIWSDRKIAKVSKRSSNYGKTSTEISQLNVAWS